MTELISEKAVEVVNESGHTVQYTFKLEDAGDVIRMLVDAANTAEKNGQGQVAVVLRTQAEMIEQGLHVQDHKAPQMMLDIEAFHQKFGLEYNGKPRMLEPALFEFRDKFISEEHNEWREEQPGLVQALTSDDGQPDHRRIALGLHQQLDALVDMVYVTLGAAYLQFGAKVFHEAWRRVQEANMAKVRCEKEGDSKRGSTFDVIKPEGWTAPDHHDLVRDHAHIPYRHSGE